MDDCSLNLIIIQKIVRTCSQINILVFYCMQCDKSKRDILGVFNMKNRCVTSTVSIFLSGIAYFMPPTTTNFICMNEKRSLYLLQRQISFILMFFLQEKKKEMYTLNKHPVDLAYAKDEWYLFAFFRALSSITYFKHLLGSK